MAIRSLKNKPLIHSVLKTHQAAPKKMPLRKAQKFQLFHPIGTQCVIGVQLVRAKARRKLMHLSLRLAFYIRIEIDRSNVDVRSLQVHPDKVLCFQGLYGFWRECSSFLNDCKTIENTGQIGFLGISDDSSWWCSSAFLRHNKDALLAELQTAHFHMSVNYQDRFKSYP